MFVRVYTVSPKRQELFAIRFAKFLRPFNSRMQKSFRCLLLNVKGPTGFEDLRTVKGSTKPCATFTHAAQKLGLLDSDEIYARAMEDACVEKSNFTQLQRFFALLICHSRPSNPQKLFDEFLDSMNPPIATNNPNIIPKSKSTRENEVLRNLEYFFNGMGSSCRSFFRNFFIYYCTDLSSSTF